MMKKIVDNSDQSFNTSNLLKALSAEDMALLKPHLKRVEVTEKSILCKPRDAVEYAYFPCGPTLISFMVLLEDAREVETVLIGREGAVGGIVSHGRLPAYCQIVVQYPGPAFRISCLELEKAKLRSPSLHRFFARYADCLMAQLFQSVACNATHTIEQRAAKWVLASHDRTNDLVMSLTQEHLAGLLGVGRSYVSRVMGRLKAQGAVKIARGEVVITDITKMKKISCDCNELVEHHFEEVLAGVYP